MDTPSTAMALVLGFVTFLSYNFYTTEGDLGLISLAVFASLFPMFVFSRDVAVPFYRYVTQSEDIPACCMRSSEFWLILLLLLSFILLFWYSDDGPRPATPGECTAAGEVAPTVGEEPGSGTNDLAQAGLSPSQPVASVLEYTPNSNLASGTAAPSVNGNSESAAPHLLPPRIGALRSTPENNPTSRTAAPTGLTGLRRGREGRTTTRSPISSPPSPPAAALPTTRSIAALPPISDLGRHNTTPLAPRSHRPAPPPSCRRQRSGTSSTLAQSRVSKPKKADPYLSPPASQLLAALNDGAITRIVPSTFSTPTPGKTHDACRCVHSPARSTLLSCKHDEHFPDFIADHQPATQGEEKFTSLAYWLDRTIVFKEFPLLSLVPKPPVRTSPSEVGGTVQLAVQTPAVDLGDDAMDVDSVGVAAGAEDPDVGMAAQPEDMEIDDFPPAAAVPSNIIAVAANTQLASATPAPVFNREVEMDGMNDGTTIASIPDFKPAKIANAHPQLPMSLPTLSGTPGTFGARRSASNTNRASPANANLQSTTSTPTATAKPETTGPQSSNFNVAGVARAQPQGTLRLPTLGGKPGTFNVQNPSINRAEFANASPQSTTSTPTPVAKPAATGLQNPNFGSGFKASVQPHSTTNSPSIDAKPITTGTSAGKTSSPLPGLGLLPKASTGSSPSEEPPLPSTKLEKDNADIYEDGNAVSIADSDADKPPVNSLLEVKSQEDGERIIAKWLDATQEVFKTILERTSQHRRAPDLMKIALSACVREEKTKKALKPLASYVKWINDYATNGTNSGVHWNYGRYGRAKAHHDITQLNPSIDMINAVVRCTGTAYMDLVLLNNACIKYQDVHAEAGLLVPPG